MEKIRLNLGCQVHAFEGWVNQDVVGDDPNIRADLVCDAAELPYEDGSVDFIYAGHLVEHYYPDTLPHAIREWYRVLKPGGTMVLLTPDSGAVMQDYVSGKLNMEACLQPFYGRIYSYDSMPERHHIVFDYRLLEAFARGGEIAYSPTEGGETIPWSSVSRLDLNDVPAELEPQMETHISRGAYQVGIILIK